MPLKQSPGLQTSVLQTGAYLFMTDVFVFVPRQLVAAVVFNCQGAAQPATSRTSSCANRQATFSINLVSAT